MDLGIEVEEVGDGVLVAEFSSPEGMLCSIRESSNRNLNDRCEADGQGASRSVLGASYLTYDRPLFIETLNDWGWFGEGAAPAWFTREPWTRR